MIELTEDQIERINKKSPNEWQANEQGIFYQPFGIPEDVKGYVVYMRWVTGGVSGGSCWDDSNPQPWENDETPGFEVLELLLKEICPQITYLQFKELEKLIQSNEDTEWEYYGNRTDFMVKYISVNDIISCLSKFE